MNLFRHKSIPSQERDEEKKSIQKVIILGILMSFIATSFIYFVPKDVMMNNSILKGILNIKPKKQIFMYLKTIQPLEDSFYTLVSENIDLSNKRIQQDNKDLLRENITAIDEMMLQWVNVENNEYMIENHYLFLDEMKIMRDILLEKNLSIEYNDEKSLVKAHEYLKKYFIIGRIRRKSLKKTFDKYDIIYLELDNRIKYITK
ncbi:hypothetical protein [Crassaminicella profunda]|uniref:hypothetical protein n=1 Tax=Crassaminicella profunda TaxID=1286698 RepID=UPI001CA6D196|nr:hypothetical protein [Crassaminicella profunda]QZY56525.1 hypothetical protein K7H06_06265 [Crassaminicella profunda]